MMKYRFCFTAQLDVIEKFFFATKIKLLPFSLEAGMPTAAESSPKARQGAKSLPSNRPGVPRHGRARLIYYEGKGLGIAD